MTNAHPPSADWPLAHGLDPNHHVPDWLLGAWQRTALRRGDGALDDSSDVVWVQTRNLFIDVRIRADRPAHTRDSTTLAAQMGFAGWADVHEQICLWHRPIDFQPPRASADRGALYLEGARLIEIGVHGNYFEEYRQIATATTPMLALSGTCTLPGTAGRAPDVRRALLVACGEHVAYARGRATTLPTGGSLAEHIAAAPEQTATLLDCEVSRGHIDAAGRWSIHRSTRPERECLPFFHATDWAIDPATGHICQQTDADAISHTWHVLNADCPPSAVADLLPRD